MMDIVGSVVTATAGRDKGRRFIVIGPCDPACVYIADGKTRKWEKPKKKKLMHLHFEPQRLAMEEKPADPSCADAWLRKSLRALGYSEQTASKEG